MIFRENKSISVFFVMLLSSAVAFAAEVAGDEVDGIATGWSEPNWYDPKTWSTVDGQPVEMSWEMSDTEIRLLAPRGGAGSLISPPVPPFFELVFDWKITAGGNNGLKYRVHRDGEGWLGIEYQMIDEAIPLAQLHTGSTASIYGLVAPLLEKPLRPAGQWNEAKVVVRRDRLEHYLNGSLVASISPSGPEWESRLVRSKFYGAARFGQPTPDDRIMLTDHGGEVVYRNLHLRPLQMPALDTASGFAAEASDSAHRTRGPSFGNGLRSSWGDDRSIVIWTRTTAAPHMNHEGPEFRSLTRQEAEKLSVLPEAWEIEAAQLPPGTDLTSIRGACPGMAGEVMLSYFPIGARDQEVSTPWTLTTAKHDFTQQWRLTGLRANTHYAAIVEARAPGTEELTAVFRGHFRTAPAADEAMELAFCLTTCHDYLRRDDDQGHKIYPAMEQLQPAFVVHAGDVEYYDQPQPWAMTVDLMRLKWGRLFALPRNRAFYANHSAYFQKDDHDTLRDDCGPGDRYGQVTFEEGARLFNTEQFPSHPSRYQTVRWGRDLQIWILEGRDYRSPRTLEDGPGKSILGGQQKAWLMETISHSDAAFKLVFSPTPILGPDRESKQDNHANRTYAYEGEELRRFFKQQENVILFCGDRHWQYASVDAESGLWEFGCGPGSEKHQLGWREDDIRAAHRFLRVAGGFLSGHLRYEKGNGSPTLSLRHRTVDGIEVSRFDFPHCFTSTNPPFIENSVEESRKEQWYGTLDAGARKFRFLIAVDRANPDMPSANLTSFDEGETEFPLDSFSVIGDQMKFELLASGAVYEGKIQANGAEVQGFWKQRQAQLPLDFRRVDQIPSDEGVVFWHGELDALVQKLVVQFREERDGTHFFDSISQKAGGFVASKKTEGDEIVFEVPALKVVYRAQLRSDGLELHGKFTQGGIPLDLTLAKSEGKRFMLPPAQRPQHPAPPYPYDSFDVFADSAGDSAVRLAGTLTVPRDKPRAAAVILISGSGPQDRDETILEHKPFLVIADHLTRRGYAVLRFDDRGTHQSTGDFQNSSSIDFAEDVRAWVRFLRQHQRIDANKIGLCGHSEGGLIASIVAADNPEIRFVVLLAGTGVPGSEVIASQSRRIMEVGGLAGEELERASKQQEILLRLATQTPPQTLEQFTEAAELELKSYYSQEKLELSEARAAIRAAGNQFLSPWFQFFLTYDPAESQRRIRCPVLILNGEKDLQVIPEINVPRIEEAVRSNGNQRVTSEIFPNLNHLFQAATTGQISEYAEIEETINPVVLERVSSWLDGVLETEP